METVWKSVDGQGQLGRKNVRHADYSEVPKTVSRLFTTPISIVKLVIQLNCPQLDGSERVTGRP